MIERKPDERIHPKDPGNPAAKSPAPAPAPLYDDEVDRRAEDEARGRRRLRSAIGIAAAFHIALLATKLPERIDAAPPLDEQPEIFVIQDVRIKEPPPEEPPPPPPPPPEREPEPPRPERAKVPMPDPVPERVVRPEPEPPQPVIEPIVREELPPMPEVEAPPMERIVEIPAPPPPPAPPEPEGPIHVTGDVKAPVKLSGEHPTYTDQARRARLQGVVVVQAVIDRQGNVTQVKVLKDQPMGLGHAAENAVKQWKFRPATLNGRPVDVYFNLTVNFTLQ